jgi:hypothetical protein
MKRHFDLRFERLSRFANPGRISFVIVLIMLMLKFGVIMAFERPPTTIFNLNWNFDSYVRSLYEGKGFIDCTEPSCDHATRMPGQPVFLWTLSAFTLNSQIAALLKAIFMSSLLYLALRDFIAQVWTHNAVARVFYAVIALALIFSPNLIKHASSVNIEEGWLVEILAITVLTLSTLLLRTERDFGRAAAAIAAASAAYLFKSSMILVLVAVASTVIGVVWASGQKTRATALLALALASPLAWLGHNVETTGRFTILSSYDGENMFRGWNAHFREVYPNCSLDILFDPEPVCDHRRLALPYEPSRKGFADEWLWNDAYKSRAIDWLRQNPAKAAETFIYKLTIFIATPRQIPYVATLYGKEVFRSVPQVVVGEIWLALARLFELTGLIMAIALIAKGDGRARTIALASLAVTAGYAIPYVIGFGYERHYSIFVMMTALFNIPLFVECARVSGRPRTMAKSEMVPRGGIEPPTLRFSVACSTN